MDFILVSSLFTALDRIPTLHGEEESLRRRQERPIMKDIPAGFLISFWKISHQPSVKILGYSFTTMTHSGKGMLFRHDYGILDTICCTVYPWRSKGQK
jgi:hypothetical protein